MNVYFQTLGCKLNQAETDQFKRGFTKNGFRVVEDFKKADLCVVNTCAVTESAVRKSRQIIHKIRNQNSDCRIVATGCSIEQAKEADFFVKDKEKLVEEVIDLLGNQELGNQKNDAVSKNEKVKAMVKIQDGCDNFCSYCLISRRRGELKSIDPQVVIKQIKELEKRGHQEVFLTGVNINKYQPTYVKASVGKFNLVELLRKILNETKIERIRLGSIDPNLVTDDLINLWKKNERLCNHWHLSLQSGSNKILEKMNRHYTRKEYLEIVKKLRKIDSYFGITTDIIVGFPGETEEDFKDSISIIKKAELAKIHVFPYSKRPGTPALKMKDQIEEKVKKERAAKLKEVAEEVSLGFREKNIDREEEVLFEGERNSFYEGHTKNYLRVFLKSDKNLQNKIIRVKLEQQHFKR